MGEVKNNLNKEIKNNIVKTVVEEKTSEPAVRVLFAAFGNTCFWTRFVCGAVDFAFGGTRVYSGVFVRGASKAL